VVLWLKNLFHRHVWLPWVTENMDRVVFYWGKQVYRKHRIRYCVRCGAVQIKAIPGTDRAVLN